MIKKLLLLAVAIIPNLGFAAEMEISGWIPYWKVAEGTKDARAHLDVLTEINPFTLSVTTDGKIKDLGNMKKSSWTRLFKAADKEGVEVIPTVMWSDTSNIHYILSDKKLRTKHIDNIVSFIKKGKYDGVDIDYEGKLADTKDAFSAFLTELNKKLGSRTLACTIEARTPAKDLYPVVPAVLEHANDLEVIGKVCDQVRVMTYDQQRADLTLNAKRSGTPYIPVADIEWVKKVAEHMDDIIPKEKIMLGVATYGREWEVEVNPNNFSAYTSQWSVTHDYAMEYAEEIGIEPFRNAGGELSYTYISTSSPYGNILNPYPAPRGTPEANEAAAKALAYANATGNPVIINVVWWSDAKAIESKLELAESLGLRGISIFKVDDTEDDELWELLGDLD